MSLSKTQTNFKLVAKTFYGLEDILADELKDLGAKSVVKQNRAIEFEGTQRLMYESNLRLRTALRVLKPIRRFSARNEQSLYSNIREISWSDYLDADDALAVNSVVNSAFFGHSKYVALKVKDAVVDQFRDKFGIRPSVDLVAPRLRINIHISDDRCTLSLDSSGDSLHKRGYRLAKHMAPLNEAFAAGLVLLSGWQRDNHFIDPMCGAGTILIEAAFIAHNMAPGMHRTFGFQHWKDYDAKLWQDIYENARKNVLPFEHRLIGWDSNQRALQAARKNLENARLADKVELGLKSFESQSPPKEGGVAIMNPPYGERMEMNDLHAFYEMIGDNLKKNYAGYHVWILSSNKDALKHIGLRPASKLTLHNGPLACKFHNYRIYVGSIKSKYARTNGPAEHSAA